MARYLRAMLLHVTVSNFLLIVMIVLLNFHCNDFFLCGTVARLNPEINLFGSSPIEYVRDFSLASGYGFHFAFVFLFMNSSTFHHMYDALLFYILGLLDFSGSN